jgi:Protein kinase domain
MLRRNLILVLEYVDGGDMEQWLQHQVSRGLRRGLLDERLIWHLFSQIANGLTYIHGRKIIHRGRPTVVLDEVTGWGTNSFPFHCRLQAGECAPHAADASEAHGLRALETESQHWG